MNIDYFKIPEINISYKDHAKTSERMTIIQSRDILKILKVAFKNCMQHHEEAHVIFLNRSNRVMGIACVSKCGVDNTIIDIKIIMQMALKAHASSIILSHNHPSGSTYPSGQDILVTKKIKEACKYLDIQFMDHIIITEEDYYSFMDEGLLL